MAENVIILMMTTKEDIGAAGNMGKEQKIRTPVLPQRRIGKIAMSYGWASRESVDQNDFQLLNHINAAIYMSYSVMRVEWD